MYTKIKNVQILVSLLKQHHIRHLVLSAGTRHVPLAHSVENDDYFHCYSVVDERSAGYFALGLAKELGEPVAIACTSSTATCNYVPPVAEAYYQKVPLLILTGDRDPYYLNQLEDQMIDQVDMYRNFCKKCVNLPVVENEKDVWYCQRLINEAILELNHHGGGPVQINFPINQSIDDIADASIPELPMYNKIDRCCLGDMPDKWNEKAERLKQAKRILVICGSAVPGSQEMTNSLEAFAERYNCVISTEQLSNICCQSAVNTYRLAEAITGDVLRRLDPEIVIFFGGNFISRLKVLLREIREGRESWLISEDGAIMDPFQNLTNVFECTPEYFFRYFAEQAAKSKNDQTFRNTILEMQKKLPEPDIRTLPAQVSRLLMADAKFKKLPEPGPDELIPDNYLSAFYAMYALSREIPKDSLVHLSILNSTRIMQLFPLAEGVSVYSNIGTDGIDGSMSTFLGQAAASNRPCYLVIGDLSFFYDMNSLGIRGISPNVHILLVNNGGGAEFYFSMGPKKLPNIDAHISAAHHHVAKDWILSNQFKYMSAHTMDEMDQAVKEFANPNADKPVVLEIFTEKERDVQILKGYRRLIHQDVALSPAKIARCVEKIPGVKQAVETEVGKSIKDKIKKGVKRFL